VQQRQVQAPTPKTFSCTVADPTGTPLNVRASPQGNILSSLPNGVRVHTLEARNDYKGSSWSLISDRNGNNLGWVITRFLNCSAVPN
jgi:Bacterial SH3 domain